MKLLLPSEIKATKEAELARDIVRTESIKDALDKVKSQLNEANDKFELSLANQQKRWAKEESEALRRINEINTEIKELERKRNIALLPIANLEKKAETYFKEAEIVLADCKEKQKALAEKKKSLEDMSDLLQLRLDENSERENDLILREKNVTLREEATNKERENIKKLSQELSNKLSNL